MSRNLFFPSRLPNMSTPARVFKQADQRVHVGLISESDAAPASTFDWGRVTFICGLGRAFDSHFGKSAKPFTAETSFFQFKKDISDPGLKKCPSQIRRFAGRPNWCVDMKRKIGVVRESFAHLPDFFSRICGRRDEGVAKISLPNQCPDLDGLHFPRVSR